MRNPFRASIQRHLVFSLTGALILLFGLSALAIYGYVRHAFYAQMDEQLERWAEDFAEETERSEDGELDAGFHDLDLDGFSEGDEGGYYELRDLKGRSLIRSKSLGDQTQLPTMELAEGEVTIDPIRLPGGLPGRIIHTSFQLEIEDFDLDDPGDRAEVAALSDRQRRYVENYNRSDAENRVHLALAVDTRPIQRSLAILASAFWITGVLLLLVTFFVIRRIVQRALVPVSRLTQMTEEIGPDDLENRLPLDGLPNELRPLIARFNALLARVGTALQRERRFSIDIAHELRTPVAEMRTLLEVAAPDADGESREVIETGARISERMTRIIETLTAIHQADRPIEEGRRESVTIDAILRAALEALSPEERARVDVSDDETARVETEPALFRAIVDNLLQNALAHSPSETRIDLSTTDAGFIVENAVSDLVEDDLERLAEPFWQKDRARAAADRFGLGLTLVGQYLKQLGGRMEHRLSRGRLKTSITLEES